MVSFDISDVEGLGTVIKESESQLSVYCTHKSGSCL